LACAVPRAPPELAHTRLQRTEPTVIKENQGDKTDPNGNHDGCYPPMSHSSTTTPMHWRHRLIQKSNPKKLIEGV